MEEARSPPALASPVLADPCILGLFWDFPPFLGQPLPSPGPTHCPGVSGTLRSGLGLARRHWLCAQVAGSRWLPPGVGRWLMKEFSKVWQGCGKWGGAATHPKVCEQKQDHPSRGAGRKGLTRAQAALGTAQGMGLGSFSGGQ